MTHCAVAGENWVCDRFANEWNEFEKQNPIEQNLFWLQADWTWNHYDLAMCAGFGSQSTGKLGIVRSIHHIVPWKLTEKDIADYLYVDRYVAAYHFPSPITAREVHRLIPAIATKPYFVAPFWVNVDIWKPSGKNKEELRRKYKIGAEDIVIGSFQRDTEGHDLKSPKLEKGPDIFCDYVEGMFEDIVKNKRRILRVLLSGWRRQYVISRLEHYGIPYVYVELPTIDVINELYEILDLYVVASRVEGGPQAIFECATKNVPIISSNVGGAKFILSAESRYDIDRCREFVFLDMLDASPDVLQAKLNVSKYEISLQNNHVEYMKLFRAAMMSSFVDGKTIDLTKEVNIPDFLNTLQKMYDYLIVGAGMYGATFAYHASVKGKTCLVVDKREHVAGNCYTENREGINVHKYGPHIFHTSDKSVWNFVTMFAEFNGYRHKVRANFDGKLYSFPINLMTLTQLWGVTTPEEAKVEIEKRRAKNTNLLTLEGWARAQIGDELYETFVEGYTMKQWNRHPSELPSSIIRRIPIRLTHNDDYFDDKYQGIPIGGYTRLVENMLNRRGIEVQTGVDFFKERDSLKRLAKKIVYTGAIDEYFDYSVGHLEYRSLRFETERKEIEDFQGISIVNYSNKDVPYTRIAEHKHFEKSDAKHTYITKEYPDEWSLGKERYYPINCVRNNAMYAHYKEAADRETDVLFGGRLGTYKYYDMHQVIAQAMHDSKKELNLE